MARKRLRGEPLPGLAVPRWPCITATLSGEGAGELSWTSAREQIWAHDRDAAHAAIVARCTRLAQAVARPVRLNLHEGERMLDLAVHPLGYLQRLGADGVPELDTAGEAAQTAVTGTCWACAAPASAPDAQCTGCGAREPLSRTRRGRETPAAGSTRRSRRASQSRVSAPPTTATPAPTATPTAPPTPTPPPPPQRRPRSHATADARRTGRRALREAEPAAQVTRTRHSLREGPHTTPAPLALVIEFEDESRAVLGGSAALGRNPSPIDGRIPVRVGDRDNTVSRTHALVDLDDAGRILVTDYHSTHGVHLSGARSSTLSPGVVYRVRSGAQLRLGDMLCRVSTARAA